MTWARTRSMASLIATRKLHSPAATGQLSGSPGPNDAPPIATSTPTSGRPRIIDATPTVSGLASASDDRARIPDASTREPDERDLDHPPRVDPGRGVDHDCPRAGRDCEQVVDVELADEPDGHVGRKIGCEFGESGERAHRRHHGRDPHTRALRRGPG